MALSSSGFDEPGWFNSGSEVNLVWAQFWRVSGWFGSGEWFGLAGGG